MAKFKFMAQRYMTTDMQNVWNALWNTQPRDRDHSVVEGDQVHIYNELPKEQRGPAYFHGNVFTGRDRRMLESGYGRWHPQNIGTMLADYYGTLQFGAVVLTPAAAIQRWQAIPRQQQRRKDTIWRLAISRAYRQREYFQLLNSNADQRAVSKYQVAVNFVNQQHAMTVAHELDAITAPRHRVRDYRNSIKAGKIRFGRTNNPPAPVEYAKMVLYLKPTVSDRYALYNFCRALDNYITITRGIVLSPHLPAFYVQFDGPARVQPYQGIGCAPYMGTGDRCFINRNAAFICDLTEGRTANAVTGHFPNHQALALAVYSKWKLTRMAELISGSRLH